MRGTPLILQLLFFYFVPSFLFKHAINRFVSLIIAMSVNYAAYFAEIFRGGYLSIPSGLKEAAKILGFSKRQVFFNISLPITVKRVLPSFAGEVVTLVKDTALASVLGVNLYLASGALISATIFGSQICFFSDCATVVCMATQIKNSEYARTCSPLFMVNFGLSCVIFLVLGIAL